jgi:hypothetical protein
VTSRGNRREAIYRTDADRRRFLGLVAELPERFGLEVHAFVLMDKHYHLVVRAVGGLAYGAAAQGVRRFEAGQARDAAKARFVEGMKRRLRERRGGKGTRIRACQSIICKRYGPDSFAQLSFPCEHGYGHAHIASRCSGS